MPNPKKIVFTGITGLLGNYFLKKIEPGYEIIGISKNNSLQKNIKYQQLDITDKDQVINFINQVRPEYIVHAASIGNVDYCEAHQEEAHRVNVEGTNNMLEAAKAVSAKFFFTSSNAIYDGVHEPFDESSKPSPIDYYGKTKLEAEDLIRKSSVSYNILRLMTMYGWFQPGGRTNPVVWIIDSLSRKQEIKVVDDIYNNHLWAGQAADVVWKLIKDDISNNTYNIAGKDCISRYDLALKVAEVFELDSSLISPVKNSYFKTISPRPKNTCFNTSKMEKELGINAISVDEGLRLMKKERND